MELVHMVENYSREINIDKPDLKKYRLAGFGFLVLNILYIIVAWWKLPPIDLAIEQDSICWFLRFYCYRTNCHTIYS